MRKRDLAILMLSAFAIFFSLQHEGGVSFKDAWMHLTDEYPIKYEAERLPPPLVADLNGDGKKEVLIATHDAKIQVLEPRSRRVDEGFSEARVLAEVSLLPDKIRVTSGRRPVAMATGYIDRYKTGQQQKQVLVVVTSGWSIMCFDSNLQKLWENNLQEDFPHNAHHREVAISISNYTLKHGDTGLVIVGGRMEMQPYIFMDPFEELGMGARFSEQTRRSATEKEASDNSGTADLRHFAFYAFAGRSGTERWRKKNENIEAQPSDASQLLPQHNYKLDVHAMNSRQPGEFECREFRESILGVMPHHWDRREDTLLKLAHFRRHKRKTLKRTPGKSTSYPFHKPEENHPPGKDSTKKISNIIGKAANYAGSAKSKKHLPFVPTITNYTQVWWVPNVVVAHQKEGIEAIHLASGRTICRLHLQEGGLHADINGDGVLDHVQAVGGNGAEQTVVSGSMEVLRPCWAIATSGVPIREQLFNITSYSPGLHGHDAIWQWQQSTGVSWSNMPSPSGMMEGGQVVPTLKPLSLRLHDNQEMILAAGEQEAVVISPGGSILATIELPAPPTHVLISEDFSNDGLTDLILVTSNGVYGFVQTRQPGALFFSMLVGCLIVVMGVIFVTQHLNSIKGKPRPSSGPR
ncbi:hypothetical protein PIB30_053059 [Stylosanthes scabra]|uniref:FG-GAP repeat-containing protein n=1 Tax=Stylosanthes scabra TaxID=79078 RepID=A0ABU6VHP4_9FABA|nr:hypothetical protein [Stylosanthes scabra]